MKKSIRKNHEYARELIELVLRKHGGGMEALSVEIGYSSAVIRKIHNGEMGMASAVQIKLEDMLPPTVVEPLRFRYQHPVVKTTPYWLEKYGEPK